DRDEGLTPRMVFFLEHTIQDAGMTQGGDRRVVSKRVLYVETDGTGAIRHLHYAPYLDCRPLAETDPSVDDLLDHAALKWISKDLEKTVQGYAIANVVPEHLDEVKKPRLVLIRKTEAAVKARLTREIQHWDHRSEELKVQESTGKANARVNSGEARKRADLLQGRLHRRLDELKLEAQLTALPPVVLGGFVVVPNGLLKSLNPRASQEVATASPAPINTQISAARAREAVMAVERQLGFSPVDREIEKLGYDIESQVPGGGLRFIEVKGRIAGAETITVTKNEILYSFNKPDHFILAMVEFLDEHNHRVRYLRRPFDGLGLTSDFNGASVNFPFPELLRRAQDPS
ncbi:MAG TPA: DUF3883 domain-containing protein, partial [Planctomycetota bacterium]|nr:DUF3883 domain-containing protein [Planctomycetota bacterium]